MVILAARVQIEQTKLPGPPVVDYNPTFLWKSGIYWQAGIWNAAANGQS